MRRVAAVLIVLIASFAFSAFSMVNPDYESPVVKVVQYASPAVVKIDVVRTTYTSFDPFIDEFFKRFFGEDQSPWGFQRKSTAVGSGFVFDPKGYILTNEHVVHQAEQITVTFLDGKKYDAEYVGGDSELDIAVIKIKTKSAEKFPTLEFGDSDKLVIGEWAIAIGNPLGLQHTVTLGVISALNRKIPKPDGSGYYTELIQTDAAINPGNSGGPLLNIHGQVIGINTAIINPTEAVNLGFAIPINKVKRFLNDLVNIGKIRKAYLGVYIQDLTQDLAKALGLKETSGAIVTQVVEGSPADKAGIKVNDIIKEINGNKISSASDVVAIVHSYAPGDEIQIVVERDGKTIQFNVTLSEQQEEVATVEEGYSKFGITVDNITESDRKEFSIPDRIEGVIVKYVEPDSTAYRVGIRRGDVIMYLNRKKIENLNDWKEAMSKVKSGDVVALMTYRNGVRRYITFTISE
ncbi:MAG: serine protease Do [Thermotogaceae bacterium]|jgi:Do/DeqQ family serine protease|nr:serine protease Do [Thermotogaceae bacterium]MDN5338188.1 serine protease Do [Thermotogaceae bacterium]